MLARLGDAFSLVGVHLAGRRAAQGDFTGLGGVGTLGSHHGVNVTSATFSGNLTFLNCVGGSGGSNNGTSGNYGVNFSSNFSLASGVLQFSSVTGGSIASNNYGVAVTGTVSAPTILGTDIYGGPGAGSDYGLYVTGTLGSASTGVLLVTAGSIGTASNEYGIYCTGTVLAKTVTLSGTGGGLYSSNVSGNHGFYINGATLVT